MRWRTAAARALRRTAREGQIHAGHLAYLGILTLFPLAILVMAVTSAFGETATGRQMIEALLSLLPAPLADLFRPALVEVLHARHGWLLAAGGVVALFSVTSYVEALRDLSFRAFRLPVGHGFLKRRLQSLAGTLIAILLGAGVLLLQWMAVLLVRVTKQLLRLSLGLPDWVEQTMRLDFLYRLTAWLTPLLLFLALWALLKLLTPPQHKADASWPGALVATLGWLAGSAAAAPGFVALFRLGLTYGALSGFVLALLFFYFVGLALVLGVELNAALAASPSRRR